MILRYNKKMSIFPLKLSRFWTLFEKRSLKFRQTAFGMILALYKISIFIKVEVMRNEDE